MISNGLTAGFAHLLKQYAMRKMERIALEFHLEDL